MASKAKLLAPWPEFLSAVDEGLSKPVELHCLGGLVLTAVYGVPRTTGDLDYSAAVPNDAYEELDRLAGEDSKLAHKHKVCLHLVGVVDLPDNHDERLIDLDLGLRNLDIKVLEVYDLVLSKLQRLSPKDIEDVKFLATTRKLSFRTLSERFSAEMKPWISNLERHELTLKLWEGYFAE